MQQPVRQIPSITPLGDRAILLQWANVISPDILQQVIRMDVKLNQNKLPGLLETVPAYQSLAIHYNPLENTFENLESHIKSILILKEPSDGKAAIHFEIPVCYSAEFGIDQNDIVTRNGIQPDQLIELHTYTEYLVYMKGFLPGFIYLGGLHTELVCSRKKDPRTAIPAGSVAIGGYQTGIYGIKSPGGWNIIGRTPVNLFQVSSNPVSPISQGDIIKFVSIDMFEYRHIHTQVQKGTYVLKATGNKPS